MGTASSEWGLHHLNGDCSICMACLVLTEQDQCNTLCERHVLCTLSKMHALHGWHGCFTLGKVITLQWQVLCYLIILL